MVRTSLPFVGTYQGVLSALGDQQRLRIVELLATAPASVGDLAQKLPISRPAVSQHLRILQAQDLVSYRPVGTRNVYRIEPSGLAALRDWLDDIWPAAFDSFVRYAHRAEGGKVI